MGVNFKYRHSLWSKLNVYCVQLVFDNIYLYISTYYFVDLLKQCRSLNEEADKAILDAKQALWGTAKDDVS